MEINALAMNYLDRYLVCGEWNEFHQLVGKMQSHPSPHWNLAAIACLAVGGNENQALPAVTAVAGLHTSIVMIDDLIDNDERFDTLHLSQGDIANLSSAILAAGLNAVFQSGLDGIVKSQIVQQINQAVMDTAIGQYWDTHSTISTEADYWRNAHLKSAPFFGAAFAVGALAGGASIEQAENYKNLGCLYGVLVQVNDDLHDCFVMPASRDWFSRQLTLPLLFASTVDHPEKQIFCEIRPQVADAQKLQQAQTILLRSGAVSYCIHCLLQFYEKVKEGFVRISPANTAPLRDAFCDLLAPAFRILNQSQGN